MRPQPLPYPFSDVAAKLEDLHAIAVEAHYGDNSPDMEQVLCVHLRSGLAALDRALEEMAGSLDGGAS
jgi:hypothetical protein